MALISLTALTFALSPFMITTSSLLWLVMGYGMNSLLNRSLLSFNNKSLKIIQIEKDLITKQLKGYLKWLSAMQPSNKHSPLTNSCLFPKAPTDAVYMMTSPSLFLISKLSSIINESFIYLYNLQTHHLLFSPSYLYLKTNCFHSFSFYLFISAIQQFCSFKYFSISWSYSKV